MFILQSSVMYFYFLILYLCNMQYFYARLSKFKYINNKKRKKVHFSQFVQIYIINFAVHLAKCHYLEVDEIKDIAH